MQVQRDHGWIFQGERDMEVEQRIEQASGRRVFSASASRRTADPH